MLTDVCFTTGTGNFASNYNDRPYIYCTICEIVALRKKFVDKLERYDSNIAGSCMYIYCAQKYAAGSAFFSSFSHKSA
jgi:hypothetical protein